MGRIARFFGFEDEEDSSKNNRNGSNQEASISDKAVFVTPEETQDYSQSIMGQLLSQELDLQLIVEYLPENGRNLLQQADALKRLLLVSNNEQDPEVVRVFEEYMATFKQDYRRAQGLSTLAQLEDLNKALDAMFLQSVEVSNLNKNELMSYVEAIQALQVKVIESEQNEDPILVGASRQLFNDKSLESEYRLKMLELLYMISQDEYSTMIRNELLNPFEKMTNAQKSKFPILFKRDLDQVSKDYGFLAYSESLINEFGKHKYTQIDAYAEELDVKIGTQALRDYSFRKMFGGAVPSEELFGNIKKLVYMRYKLNEIQHELPQLSDRKAEKEQQEKERQEREEADRQQKEEAQRQANEAARLAQEQEAERQRLAKEKAEEEARKVVDATNEEIQARINELNRDVTQTGSRFVNILDFQKLVAKAKGLLPADDMIQAEGLVYKIFSSEQIIRFIKHANEQGVNYVVFPDSQEGGDGGFNVVVSESDRKVLEIPEYRSIFSPQRGYVNGNSAYQWKKYGTIPEYFLQKMQELYEDSDVDDKDKYKEYFYANTKDRKDIYEIGLMKNYESTPAKADKFMASIIRQANEELGKQWRDKQEDKDVLCYISISATQNMIPVLQYFQAAGITPYFERVPATGKRNTQNRDDIHIYFYRKDYDEFWYQVRPKLINVPEDQRIKWELHYGKDFDFRKENPQGLKLPMLDEDQQEK